MGHCRGLCDCHRSCARYWPRGLPAQRDQPPPGARKQKKVAELESKLDAEEAGKKEEAGEKEAAGKEKTGSGGQNSSEQGGLDELRSLVFSQTQQIAAQARQIAALQAAVVKKQAEQTPRYPG